MRATKTVSLAGMVWCKALHSTKPKWLLHMPLVLTGASMRLNGFLYNTYVFTSHDMHACANKLTQPSFPMRHVGVFWVAYTLAHRNRDHSSLSPTLA